MASEFINREISHILHNDPWPGQSMLFIAGPRQCGKTTLSRRFLEEKGCSALYYNWDIIKIRQQYRRDPDMIAKDASRVHMKPPYIVIDEIHKTTRWKNMLKGLFDEYGHTMNIIVTGSARLDLFRRSGDSLVGRYSLVNLFPFSLREWSHVIDRSSPSWLHEDEDWKDPGSTFEKKLSNSLIIPKSAAEAYLKFGPFPGPLLTGSEKHSRKWHRDYLTLLVREDLRDLSAIRELDRVSHLVELLPSRIGAPLSLRNLAQDLEANHSTVQNWLQALRRLYLLWPLRPYAAKIQRTFRKEPKWYFLDWTYAAEKGSRFENMIASSLYGFVVSLRDRGWPELEMYYLRTYDKKEIDFVLVHKNKPVLAIEAKLDATAIPRNLIKFGQMYEENVPVVLVINEPGVFLKKGEGKFIVGYDRLMTIL